VRSSDPPSDSKVQAPANLPSCLSAPLQSMTAVARRSDSPFEAQTASGEPDTAFAQRTAPSPARRLRRSERHRAEARDRAEARTGHTPVQPKSDTMSRTARQTRDSPKRATPCSRIPHARRERQARNSEHPRVDTSDRSRGISSRSIAQRTHGLRTPGEPSPPRSSTDPAPSHRRGNATGTSRSIAEATYRTIRFVRSRAR